MNRQKCCSCGMKSWPSLGLSRPVGSIPRLCHLTYRRSIEPDSPEIVNPFFLKACP